MSAKLTLNPETGLSNTVMLNDDGVEAMLTSDVGAFRTTGRLYATGIPTLLTKWMAGELARPDGLVGEVAAALQSVLGSYLGTLIASYVREEGHEAMIADVSAQTEKVMRATLADVDGTERRLMSVEEAQSMGAEASAEASSRVAASDPQPELTPIRHDVSDPTVAMEQLQAANDPAADAAARLVATEVHGTILRWIREEIARGGNPFNTVAASLTCSTTPIGLVLSLYPPAMREQQADRIQRSFRLGILGVAKAYDEVRARAGR